MRNPIHDVSDVQSLVTRHQLSMLQYCTVYFDGLVKDCSNSSATEQLSTCIVILFLFFMQRYPQDIFDIQFSNVLLCGTELHGIA